MFNVLYFNAITRTGQRDSRKLITVHGSVKGCASVWVKNRKTRSDKWPPRDDRENVFVVVTGDTGTTPIADVPRRVPHGKLNCPPLESSKRPTESGDSKIPYRPFYPDTHTAGG